MEPIGIFILAMLCQVYSCAANVSDSVEQMSYASVAGEEYLQGDAVEVGLNDKVYFDFDKASLDAEDKILAAINELRKDVNREQEHLEERISKLEQWRWILIGVLIAISAVVPNMGKIVSMLAN